MGYETIYRDILFIEGKEPSAKIIAAVSSDLSFKIGAQLKNLNNVKDDLINKALLYNANAIVEFTYGQKSRWLAIDDVAYYGKGYAAILPQEAVEKMKDKIKNRK